MLPGVSVMMRGRLANLLLRPSAKATFVTAAQKRALNEKQLSGNDASEVLPAESSTPSTGSPSSSSTTMIPEIPQSNGGSLVFPVTALLAVATGTAYYMNMLPGSSKSSTVDISKMDKDVVPTLTTSVKTIAPIVTPSVQTVEAVQENTANASENTPIVAVKLEKKKKPKGDKEIILVEDQKQNRVIQILSFPPNSEEKDRRFHEQTLSLENVPKHDPEGHRVTLTPRFSATTSTDSAPTTMIFTDSSSSPKTSFYDSVLSELNLKTENTVTVDETLKRAHALLKGSLDESFLVDLEILTPAQLRIRVVQLVSEMAERTKWEAVRLKEFLQLKEREVTDHFMEILQKQRLEFEDLLARRLREREYEISKAANEMIQAKDKSIESLLDAAIKTQKQEHDAEIDNVKGRLQLELSTKHDVALESKIAALKEQFAKELSEKLHEIVQLKERMESLQSNLESSRIFESSSQKTHRVSAAALALMEKLESGHSAVEQFAALKDAASENEVIASALLQVPSNIKIGIPTLSELQASFDNVHKAGRQAALVPMGKLGLGGQFTGILLSKLTVPPSSDSIVSLTEEDCGAKSDYVLSCANYYVKTGDLEKAVYELEKLSGQTAYAVKDWKKAALDRIAVEKVLKVIKLECSLMNKSMGGGA